MQENYYNCIYMYINKINNKKYVGQAKNFNKRHKQHIRQSSNKNNKNQYNLPFHNAIRKYGIENFKIVILKENLQTQCLMNLYECYYIKKYNTLVNNKHGYNLSNGGSNGNVFAGKTEKELIEWKQKISKANSGRKLSEETKKKISEINKNKIVSKETRNKISKANKGKMLSQETKKKISEKNKGRIISEEIKKEMSNQRKGEGNSFYGKHHTEQTKRKLRELHEKKIAQYDKQCNLIKIWNSGKDVYEKIKIDNRSVCHCCKFWEMDCNKEEWFKKYNRRPVKYTGGFGWKYLKDVSDEDLIRYFIKMIINKYE